MLRKLHDPVSGVLNKLGFNVCFTGRMPMRTVWGQVRADEVVVGMRLLSRDEFDPEGPVVACEVEEVFVREGLVWLLRVMGQLIESTGEHPFWVQDKGWTPLNQIHAGDWIWTEAGGWVRVDAVEETGRWETVYNFRIAQHHTYFVGEAGWGFSLWAHNANYKQVLNAVKPYRQPGTRFGKLKAQEVARAINQGTDKKLALAREILETSVKGVGPKTAQKIVASLKQNGPKFHTTHTRPAYYKVTNSIGTTYAEGVLTGSHIGRKKGYLPKPVGGRAKGHHKGHLIPENGVANPKLVNVKANSISEAAHSNLSPKKIFENFAIRVADTNPTKTVRTLHFVKRKPGETVPYEVKHQVYANNKLMRSEAIPNV